jgi:hypothetical protein
MSEIESQDFFRDDELVNDPYPYLAHRGNPANGESSQR